MSATRAAALDRIYSKLDSRKRLLKDAEDFEGFWWNETEEEKQTSKDLVLSNAIRECEIYEYILRLIQEDND
jgi:ribosomal protein L20A (L18A)